MRYQPEPKRSLLDRLTDCAPEGAAEPSGSPCTGLDALMESVLRDIENLLNTRSFATFERQRGPAPQVPVPPDVLVRGSLLNYGSRDFSLENPRSQRVRGAIRQEILKLLTHFEPRLKNVIVRMDTVGEERALNFRIEATLQVEPVQAPAVFDTRFDINRGCYSILT